MCWTTKESCATFEVFKLSSAVTLACAVRKLLHFCCTVKPCGTGSPDCEHTQRECLIQDKSCQTLTCGGMTPPQMTRISGLFSFRSSWTSSGTRVLCPAASVLTPTQWTSASTACWATSRGVFAPEWREKKKPAHYGWVGNIWFKQSRMLYVSFYKAGFARFYKWTSSSRNNTNKYIIKNLGLSQCVWRFHYCLRL